MTDNDTRTTALYIRVSTDFQAEEGYSIEAQKEMLEGYCRSRQIRNYRFYIDGGFSGSNIERPGMLRLIEDIKNRKIKAVVVYKLDRLSRSQKDTLYLIEDVLNPNQTEFVSLNENLDTSTSIGRAMLGIMSAFAQLERETIKERTRMGMKKRVESGLWPGGGKIPYGFRYNRKTGKLEPDENAETVKKMYELYLNGYSTGAIAEMLGFLYDQSVLQILKRRSNYGAVEYNGAVIEGSHEPIISKETYEKTMKMMKERSRLRTPKSDYLLSGLLVCGVCGAKMRYQKWGKNATKLVCYSRQNTKKYLKKSDHCTLPLFEAEEVEKLVLNDIFHIETENLSKTANQGNTVFDELKKRITESEKKLKRLYDLYAENGDEILKSAILEQREILSKLQRKYKKEQKAGILSRDRKEKFQKLRDIKGVWGYISPHEQQQFIRSIVEKVVVYEDKIEVIYKL